MGWYKLGVLKNVHLKFCAKTTLCLYFHSFLSVLNFTAFVAVFVHLILMFIKAFPFLLYNFLKAPLPFQLFSPPVSATQKYKSFLIADKQNTPQPQHPNLYFVGVFNLMSSLEQTRP